MNLPFTLSPDDPRWENFMAQPPGNIASNVRAEPTTTSKVIDALMIGIPTRCKHIPVDKLTEAEKFYSHDVKYRWYAIMLAGRPGWIREDVVKLLPVGVDPTPTVVLPPVPVVTPDPPQNSVDTPSLPVEVPPMTSVPTSLLLILREWHGTRSNEIKDAIRGLERKAAEHDDLITQIDMCLSKKVA